MSTGIIYWAALATYALSLVLPGFVTQSDDPSSANWLGYFILGIGWLGMFASQFAWYANLLFLAAAIAARFKGPAVGAGLAALAFALGLQSFMFHDFPLDEGGARTAVVDHLANGFYVWELSFLLLAAHCLVMLIAGARKAV